MTRRFGREAATYLAEPLLAGIHAGDVDRLSVRALFPAIRGRRAHSTAACSARFAPGKRGHRASATARFDRCPAD